MDQVSILHLQIFFYNTTVLPKIKSLELIMDAPEFWYIQYNPDAL